MCIALSGGTQSGPPQKLVWRLMHGRTPSAHHHDPHRVQTNLGGRQLCGQQLAA
jgi:hypothetical protein